MSFNLINNTLSCKMLDILDDILGRDFSVDLYIRFSDTIVRIMLLRTDIIKCGKFYFPL